MSAPAEFPRVAVPGLDVSDEMRAAVAEMVASANAQDETTRRNQRLLAYAMQALRKPIFRIGKPKPKKVTRHSRRMQQIAVRAAYVKETRA